ncbi:dihydrofolate reductase [Candidatus Woesearchaeota archaeon]|nr:dihydrofolate reductase [Candidatus Woesearchaeota archaeon]
MISLIVGMTPERVIGNKNELPWYISEDLKNFKALTSENIVIMGRNTYDSIIARIGKPLPNRTNIVISRSMEEKEGIQVCRSIQEAIALTKKENKEAFIIGGAQIYKEALPFVDKMYISYVKKAYKGDTLFPEWNKNEWEEIEKKPFEEFDFVILQRKKK